MSQSLPSGVSFLQGWALTCLSYLPLHPPSPPPLPPKKRPSRLITPEWLILLFLSNTERQILNPKEWLSNAAVYRRRACQGGRRACQRRRESGPGDDPSLLKLHAKDWQRLWDTNQWGYLFSCDIRFYNPV